MRCKEHPTVNCPKGQTECFLCGDGAYVEPDWIKFEYEKMARHIEPGNTTVRTRGQYQRLLKRHGRTDDITHKELRQCVTDTAKRERVREEKISNVLHKLEPILRQAQHQGNAGSIYQQSQQRDRRFREKYGG